MFPLDVAYYAGRFRADLSQLGGPAEPREERADVSDSQGDPALFDFFGNLSVLLLAVRAGDLPRAQAAANALEMEVLVERSAGRAGEPAAPPARRRRPPVRSRAQARGGGARAGAPTRARAAARSLWRTRAEEGGAADDAPAPYFDAEGAGVTAAGVGSRGSGTAL